MSDRRIFRYEVPVDDQWATLRAADRAADGDDGTLPGM